MPVTPLPSIRVLMNILGLGGSSIPHHCPQTPRHRDHLRRALAKQRVQEQLEPKAPEPEDGRAHTGVQTELCSDEPGDHGIKMEMVCQADVHLERPPSLLCSPAEEGGAVARQAEGGERSCVKAGRHHCRPSAKTVAWAFTVQVLAELFDSTLYIICERLFL
ncbi:radial spoke head protein 3 homolog isoform X2 [Athene noctua]|uniref:radial spoke head protein 3 homolog isoform X2 n=1 Tax=Athene noctua TaxID=126797 RepID=UPI003EB8CC2A